MPSGERIGGQGISEIESLHAIAILAPQKSELRFGFYAFGNHFHAERLAERVDRLNNLAAVGVLYDIAHERA